MKLLYCFHCNDIFKLLVKEPRSCKCGLVTGHYIDNFNAVTNGNGVSVAIGNGSFMNAIYDLRKIEGTRDVFVKKCAVICWVRPNEGTGNPHTKVEKEESYDKETDHIREMLEPNIPSLRSRYSKE